MNMKWMNIKRVVIALLATACGNGQAGYDAVGTFEATEVIVSAEIGGKICHLPVEEGQYLRAGVPVGLIDTVPLSLERELLERKARVVESRGVDIPRQVAAARQELATARAERQRFDNLVQANAAARKQLDDLDARVAVLELELEARLLTLQEHNRGVEAELRALEAEMALLADRLSRTRVVSPIDGTVLAKYAEPGEIAPAGRALFKVGDTRNMILRCYLPASLLSRARPGQAVTLFTGDGQDGSRSYPGQVTWISDRAEFTPKSVQTRDERANQVYAIKVATRNDGYLKIGMYGEIKFDD